MIILRLPFLEIYLLPVLSSELSRLLTAIILLIQNIKYEKDLFMFLHCRVITLMQ